MKIIAIDSSGLVASVAILDGDVITAEYTTNFKKTHSQTLLPMLDAVKHMTELDLSSVDAIAVAAGPGSFTGLRIGSATAKGLGLALDKPIVEVPTVDSLSYNLYGITDVICPIMDARRDQVYTGYYKFNDKGEHIVLKEQFAEAIENVAAELNEMGQNVVFLGDGVPVYRQKLEEFMKVPYRFAPPHMLYQSAASLAILAAKYYMQGKYVTAAEHTPIYLRMSQAERERCMKQES